MTFTPSVTVDSESAAGSRLMKAVVCEYSEVRFRGDHDIGAGSGWPYGNLNESLIARPGSAGLRLATRDEPQVEWSHGSTERYLGICGTIFVTGAATRPPHVRPAGQGRMYEIRSFRFCKQVSQSCAFSSFAKCRRTCDFQPIQGGGDRFTDRYLNVANLSGQSQPMTINSTRNRPLKYISPIFPLRTVGLKWISISPLSCSRRLLSVSTQNESISVVPDLNNRFAKEELVPEKSDSRAEDYAQVSSFLVHKLGC